MSHSMSAEVKNYLERTNRPYSATDVYNNMNTNDKKVGKTAVNKALEELAANQLIKEKVNGKQKVYFADQNNFNDMNVNQMQQMDRECQQLSQESKEIEKELKSKESKLSTAKTSLTSEQLSQELTQMKDEINGLQRSLEEVDSKAKDFDPELNDKVKAERQTLVTEWKKRKRMATDMIEMILEGYPKSKKALIEEIGIETDEDIKVVLPQI